ncbi:F0F1 ATP synthase subunit B [Mycoplasmopsis gallopavonis]|uniref:ATP synthase subunit b n=1 Tax=Mycoplasmopsis gallopavonis TaxID=76629 RepID=A0A449AZ94_9BACT|nr:F0F1 ATP synthase subunit B [Mycoplasmopsis gallopavonis]RIV16653.1 ATP synthase F0 subunit B [Mycoplasmopsis gallopavonis]VEU72848.1 ATP synthase subunit b [Mycoplasmopsis gallopavonis]
MTANLQPLLAEEARPSLSEKFASIFPSWPIMVATIIAFVIVFLCLYKLVYKPVKQMVKARQDYIQANIDDSLKQKESSLEKLEQANQNLIEARKQADIIVVKAKLRAEKVSNFYTQKAKAQSKRLLEETQVDINAQKREFEENSKKYVVQVATELANKILKREISSETQDQIINQFLNSEKEVSEL